MGDGGMMGMIMMRMMMQEWHPTCTEKDIKMTLNNTEYMVEVYGYMFITLCTSLSVFYAFMGIASPCNVNVMYSIVTAVLRSSDLIGALAL